MNAVESGNADYGYGNAYSVTYYMSRNGYRNIITVPIGGFKGILYRTDKR